MKKRLIQIALILGLMALTCAAAQATEADAPASGFRLVAVESDYADDITLTPTDAKGAEVKLDDTRYPGAVKVDVAYNKAQDGKEYLLCVLADDESGVPSADNMAYIDQKQAEGTSVKFTAFPKVADDQTTKISYTVYLSSNADASSENPGITTFTKVAAFEYYGESAVLLGDVDGNGTINAVDARIVLQGYARLITLTEQQSLAANVNKDNAVNAVDARLILQFYARLISSFD